MFKGLSLVPANVRSATCLAGLNWIRGWTADRQEGIREFYQKSSSTPPSPAAILAILFGFPLGLHFNIEDSLYNLLDIEIECKYWACVIIFINTSVNFYIFILKFMGTAIPILGLPKPHQAISIF